MKAFLLLSSLCCLLLTSCLSQRLQSESGLYDVALEHSYKVATDGFWTWGKGNPCAHQASGAIYVAPLNISKVQENHPELAPVLVEQMHDLMSTNMSTMLAEANQANHTHWELTEDASAADLLIELAVVKLRTQKPALNVASKVLDYIAPTGVGDALGLVARGDITLEGTIRDNRNGQLILAFKDSNRAKIRFYHKDAYSRTGNVDANLRLWARRLATLCRDCAYDRMGDKTLREKIDELGVKDAIRAHLHN